MIKIKTHDGTQEISEELAILEEIIHKLVNIAEAESRAEYANKALDQITIIKNKP